MSASNQKIGDITKEFASLFTTLSSRVSVFKTTQKAFLDKLNPKIKEILPELEGRDLEEAIAIYGISVTDDALKNYDIDQFADDIRYLRSLIDKEILKQQIKVQEESKPVESEKPKGVNVFRPRDYVEPEYESRRSITKVAVEAAENESVFMKLLTAYYQSNTNVEKIIVNLNNDIILHNVNERPEIVITSLLIREHFLPLFETMYAIYESVPIQVDIRFFAAQILVAFERLLNPENLTRSQAFYLNQIKEEYPLGDPKTDGDCDDLYFDISEQILFSKYYPRLKGLLQSQIDEAKLTKEESRKAMLNSLERVKSQPQQGSTESIRSSIDSVIFETFHFNRKFEDSQRVKMERSVESVMKRMALEKFGTQDILEFEKFRVFINTEFFEPIFTEYPQMLLPFIDIRLYSDFTKDPVGHIDRNRDYILNQFWFAMRKHGASNRPGISQLAHAFSKVMFDIMVNKKVLDYNVT